MNIITLGVEPATGRAVTVPLATITRHGLIAGATGTGKTRTLQVIVEQLSDAGVPVVLADLKGDLSGLCQAGTPTARILQRAAATGCDWQPKAYPVEFFTDPEGDGVPLRATVDGFGPLLLSRVLGLNANQEANLAMIFHAARDRGDALTTLEDLRGMVHRLVAQREALRRIGGLSPASCTVILRKLVMLGDRGGDVLFGTPPLDPSVLLEPGRVSLLDAAGLPPERQAIFDVMLLWLLSRLATDLPEVGDLDRPKLVVMLDEAHLLFERPTPEFLSVVTRTVKTIRSRGVGVILATQSPTDIPGAVLGQLALRVQHALRAFTPKDAADLRKVVSTWPISDRYDIGAALRGMGTGTAMATVLDENGVPTAPVIADVQPPRSHPGKADDDARAAWRSGIPAPEPEPEPEPESGETVGLTDLAAYRERVFERRAAEMRRLGIM